MASMNLTSQEPYKNSFNFAATFNHWLARRGLVELVPTSWVLGLSNQKAGQMGELHDKTPANLKTMWDDILKIGLIKPFLLSAGRVTRDCRLESGNHRIQLFSYQGIECIPASAMVADDCVISIKNGEHRYYRTLLIEPTEKSDFPFDERIFMRPSDVFADLRIWKETGSIPVPKPNTLH